MKYLIMLFVSLVAFFNGYSIDSPEELLDKGKYRQVVSMCDSLMDSGEETPDMFYYKGKAYMSLYNFAEAAICFEKYLNFIPDDEQIQLLLASVSEGGGDVDKAKDIYNKLIQKDSTNVKALVSLADIYKSEREYLKVVDMYSRLVKLDTSNGYFYSKLGYYCFKSGLNPQAVAFLDQAISLNHNDFTSKNLLVKNLIRISYYERANYYVDSFLTIYPDNLEMMKHKALLTALGGNDHEAVKLYKDIMALGDTSLSTCKYLGQSLYNTNNYEEATVWLSRYIRSVNDDYGNHFILALAYRQSYKYEESLKHFQQTEQLRYNPYYIAKIYKEKAEAFIMYGDYCGFRDSLAHKKEQLYHNASVAFGEALKHCTDCSDIYLKLARFNENKLKNTTVALHYYEEYYKNKDFSGEPVAMLNWIQSKITELKEQLFFEE